MKKLILGLLSLSLAGCVTLYKDSYNGSEFGKSKVEQKSSGSAANFNVDNAVRDTSGVKLVK